MSEKSKMRLSLLAVILLAIGMRLWRIDVLPPGFHLDEAAIGIESWRVVSVPTYRPIFFQSNSGILPVYVYANALILTLFKLFNIEVTPAAVRFTSVFFGVLGVMMVFGLAQEVRISARHHRSLSMSFPFFVAVSLAIMRWHVHFSRMAIEPILTPLIWSGATWALLRGWRTGSWLWFGACGLITTLGIYAYRSAWIIPLLIFVTSILLIRGGAGIVKSNMAPGTWRTPLSDIPIVKNVARLILAGVIGIVLVIPLGLYALEHREEFFYRYNRVSIADENEILPNTEVLARNIWKTAAMYNPFGRTGDKALQRNIPGEPALNIWAASVFLLGALVGWKHRRDPVIATIWVGLIGLSLPGLVTGTVPHFHRIIGMSAPTAIFMGIGLDLIWQWHPYGKSYTKWFVGLIISLIAVISVRDYFVRWADIPELPEAYNTASFALGNRLAELPADMETYLTPIHRVYSAVIFDSILRGRPEPTSFDGTTTLPLTIQAIKAPQVYVVIERDDQRTGPILTKLFPDIEILDEIKDYRGEVFARLYLVPPHQPLQIHLQHSPEFDIGDGIELAAYELSTESVHQGTSLHVTVEWLARTQPMYDVSIAVNLLQISSDGEPKIVSSSFYPPGEGRPYAADWRTDRSLLDEYVLDIPDDIAPGFYDLVLVVKRPDALTSELYDVNIKLGVVNVSHQ